MRQKLLITTLLTASFLGTIIPTQAAFIFENENQELEWSRTYQKAHLMKKGEFEDFCQTNYGVKATFVPQTIWDLFVCSNFQKARYKLPRVDTIKVSQSLTAFQLSSAFRNYLHSLKLTQALADGQFTLIAETMMDDLQRHLQTYQETQKAPTEDDINIWLNSRNEHLTPLRTLLISACDIEWKAYNNNELLLWRHSRTNLSLRLEGQELQVSDLPLKIVTYISAQAYFQADNKDSVLATPKQALGLGCLSYAYSLMGNYINDGTLHPLGGKEGGSACAISYFMAELRDRAFAEGKLPFKAVGSSWGLDTPETIRTKLPALSFISVTRMPKALLAEPEEWFLPEITPNLLAFQIGETSHPRHRGTITTSSGDERVNHTLKPYTTDGEVAHLAAQFVRQSTPQILVLNGHIVKEQDREATTKIIEGRKVAANILCSDNASKIAELKGLLPKQTELIK